MLGRDYGFDLADEGWHWWGRTTRLDSLAGEVKEDAEILAEQKKISVSISKIEEVTVLGDSVRLRQLMLNLVDNAIKYTPDGGRVHVTGPRGERTIALRDLHRLPGDEPQRDTTLEPGELITAVTVSPPPAGARRRHRASA